MRTSLNYQLQFKQDCTQKNYNLLSILGWGGIHLYLDEIKVDGSGLQKYIYQLFTNCHPAERGALTF